MTKEATGIGAGGEKSAAQFLVDQGYEILEYNYRVSGSEVDLIAFKDHTLCFVEVKTRGTDDYGLPEEFVDRRKIRKIMRAAKIFSADQKFQDCYIRFDIIAIIYQDNDIIINHIKHAFESNY
jgi:putative endonuclease